MRRSVLAAVLFFPAAHGAAPAMADPATYVIDPEHTVVALMVDHLGYAKTLLQFTDVSGSFVYDDETQTLSDVTATVGADSIESFSERRDGHVRGKDFLDVATFPEITFTADGGTPASDTTGTVEGTLTLLGQSLPMELEVTLNKIAPYPFLHQKETIGVSARGTITRSDFGMTYAVEGGIVGDTVDVLIEVEALRED
ncbi:MAG: YceI family protein [Rhodobacteraceae bacterium]|nr:YceI family protein [Paracoccaceae bacterium]